MTRRSPARESASCSTQRWSSRMTASHIGLNPKAQQQMLANKIAIDLIPQGTFVGAHPRRRLRPRRRADADRRRHPRRGRQAEDRGRWQDVSARDGAACRLRAGPRVSRRLSRQPLLRAHRAQLQSGDGDGGRHRHRHRRQHRSGRRHRARPCRDARRRWSIISSRTGDAWTHKPSSPGAWRRSFGPATSSISASAFRRWSRITLPAGLNVFFQSENGLIGTGPIPEQGMAHPLLTDAGGKPISALPGAATFDSAMSFGLIRGGHVDVTVLGGLQVDAGGHLANWTIPGKMVPGMGGAMDLVSGAKRVIVAMQHAAKGKSKIVAKCNLPLTSVAAGRPGRDRNGGDRLSRRQGDAAGDRAGHQRRRSDGGDGGRTRHSRTRSRR